MKKYVFIVAFFSILSGLDYALEDVNTTSPTFGEIVGPSYFHTQGYPVSINYFGWET